ncbi:MAG: hypothetical protein AAF502_22460 [Bacteroidota bacterium]
MTNLSIIKYIGVFLLIFGLGNEIAAQVSFNITGGNVVQADSFLVLNNAKFSNSGTYTANGGTVTFTGDGADNLTTIGGTSFTTFYNLHINKSSNNVLLDFPAFLINRLSFSGGQLDLQFYNLVIFNGGTITGANANRYVKTSGAGYLAMTVPGNSTDILFPVGNSTYNPLTLNNAGTQDAYFVRVLDDILENGLTGSAITELYIDRTWDVAEDFAGGSNITMTAQWNQNEELTNFNRDNAFITHYDAGWDLFQPEIASGNNPYTISRSGITSFSPFSVASISVCPTIGAITPVAAICEGTNFSATASGLADMSVVLNGDQNFGLSFVAFPAGSPPSDPYTGGELLNTVGFGALGGIDPNQTATASMGASLLPGDYLIYAILSAPPNDVNCRPSVSTTLTVIPDVAINTQPSATVFCPGDDYTLNVSATGSSLTYQWKKDNVNIPGATGTSLSLTNLQSGDAGNYTVEITSSCSSITSNVATLTEDNVAPIVSCSPLDFNNTAVIFSDPFDIGAFGTATWTQQDIDAVTAPSIDNCQIVSRTVSPTSFDCASIGMPLVFTFTLTDQSNNSSTCTITYTNIVDSSAPDAQCRDVTVQLDASGNGTLTTAEVDNGSSDLCGVASLALSQTVFNCQDVNMTTVTLTVTDDDGNTDTCTSNVTVEENNPATAVCQDITVELDNNGDASIAGDDIYNNPNDVCDLGILSVAPNAFDCNNLGDNMVTLTVTDVHNNTSTCSATVTVEDNTAPIVSCSPVDFNNTAVIFSDPFDIGAFGTATWSQSDIDGVTSTSIDNCSIVSRTVSPPSVTCDDIGTSLVFTFTLTDQSNNSSSCTITYTNIVDTTAPDAQCQDVTVQLDATGNGTLSTTEVDNGSSDLCAIASMSLSQTAFDCQDVTTNTVTLTVTDESGNDGTCIANVTVVENSPATAICQDVIVELNSQGNGSITADDIYSNSSDICSLGSFSLSQNTFDCDDLGVNMVTLTVTDFDNNTSTCEANVTVEDNIAPIVSCSPLDFNNTAVTISDPFDIGAFGTAVWTQQDIDGNTASSIDNCSIVSRTVSPPSITCDDIGTSLVFTFTLTDQSNNSSSCTITYTNIVDSTAPDAQCQDVTVQLDANGNGTLTTTEVDNGSSDLCAIASMSLSQTTFDCQDVSSTTVTLTITDDSGNDGTCSANVTVLENSPATAVCQDITVELNNQGNASISGDDIYNNLDDICNLGTLVVAPNTFDCTNLGDNMVTLTVTDVNNNTTTCEATVTVEDNIAPIVSCSPIDFNNTAVTISDPFDIGAFGTAAWTQQDIDGNTASSIDNCSIVSRTVSPPSITCDDIGTSLVFTFTLTDQSNNSSSCTITYTNIVDSTAPDAQCQDVTVQLDANGNGTLTAAEVDNGSSDLCAIASMSLSQTTFDCQDVSSTTVTLTVTDESGNDGTCTANVTVVEANPSTAVCQDITVELNSQGTVVASADDVYTNANDVCNLGNVSISPNVFGCDDLGDNTVVLTVTDVNNNTTTCEATVTVEDNIAPIVSCSPVDFNNTAVIFSDPFDIGATGISTWTQQAIDGVTSTSIDNCQIVSRTVTPNSIDCSDIGSTVVFTFTLTDQSNNSSSCTITYTNIVDNTAPIAQCQDVTVQLDANGNGTLTTTEVDNGSSDLCEIASMSLSQTAFDCQDVGSTSVTLTVTDESGNDDTCSAIVNIEDNIAPVAICQDISVELDVEGSGSFNENEIDNGSNDACSIANTSFSTTFFECSNVGDNTVILTVTDVNGNTATCDAIVTIEDNIQPTITCPAYMTIQLGVDISPNNTGTATGDDNCPGSIITSSDSFAADCGTTGTITRTWTIMDPSGNSVSCDQEIMIIDTTDPVAACQAITVTLDQDGSASISPDELDNGSSDLSMISFSASQVTFDCFDVGDIVVDLVVTDVCGNANTCSTIVTVVNGNPATITGDVTDQLGPVILDGAIDITVGTAGPPYQYLWSNSATTEDISELEGLITYTVSVTDNNGCETTASFFVDQGDLVPTEFCLRAFPSSIFNPFAADPFEFLTTNYLDQGLFPLDQPFTNGSWNYLGTESFPDQASVLANSSDWVYLTVRSSLDPAVVSGEIAGILLSDGSIVTVDGDQPAFFLDPAQTYYVEVNHPNHLPVSTATPLQIPMLGGSICHDFTTAMTQAYRDDILNDDPMNEMIALTGNYFGMVAGNVLNLDQQVDANDVNLLFLNYLLTNTTGSWDVNRDGIVDVNDLNLLFFNYNRNSHKPY